MRFLRLAWRTLLVVGVFAGVGVWVADAVVRHADAAGNAVAQVRLAGMMAGLFAGGAAAALVGIAVLLVGGGRQRRE